jgi:hypothetical protein
MGLDLHSVTIHCLLKKRGTNFRRVAMLGRQQFAASVTARALSSIARAFGISLPLAEARGLLSAADGYAEPFYKWLGAEKIDSFDISDYEGATRIWDMNSTLPERFEGCYDFVFDGGTLEHVFHYPMALRGALALAEIGGCFLSATPANSCLGHGFYQLGPDLPYALFHAQNGYACGQVLVAEMRRKIRFYQVLPPEPARGRALASTPWPATMFFWGDRVGAVPDHLTAVQPDYAEAWREGSHHERASVTPTLPNRLARAILSRMPAPWVMDLLRMAKLIYVTITGNAFFDRRSFRRLYDI